MGHVYARRKRGIQTSFLLSRRLLDYAAPVLRAARKGAGLSRIQIAARAGVSHATISRLETGKTWPGGRTVESVIDAYVTAVGLTQLEVLDKVVEMWRDDEYGGA
jgi:predicted transcriptional regulator